MIRSSAFDHLPTNAAPLPVGVHRDAFDVSGSQSMSTVEQPPLDHGRVADDRFSTPGDCMHAAEAVLPVVLGHLAVEGEVEHLACLRQDRAIDVGGVCDL